MKVTDVGCPSCFAGPGVSCMTVGLQAPVPPHRERVKASRIRFYCCFTSSFRGDAAPCISHETVDNVKTLCGRLVADAATLEDDDNNLDPDCRVCYHASVKLRASKGSS